MASNSHLRTPQSRSRSSSEKSKHPASLHSRTADPSNGTFICRLLVQRIIKQQRRALTGENIRDPAGAVRYTPNRHSDAGRERHARSNGILVVELLLRGLRIPRAIRNTDVKLSDGNLQAGRIQQPERLQLLASPHPKPFANRHILPRRYPPRPQSNAPASPRHQSAPLRPPARSQT